MSKKKIDYRTYECTDSDPDELSVDSDSDTDSIIANHIADYRLYYPSSEESDDNPNERDDYEEPPNEIDIEIFETSDSGYDSEEHHSQSGHEEYKETCVTCAETHYIYLTTMFEVLHHALSIDLVKAYNEEDFQNLEKIYSIFHHNDFTKIYKKNTC